LKIFFNLRLTKTKTKMLSRSLSTIFQHHQHLLQNSNSSNKLLTKKTIGLINNNIGSIGNSSLFFRRNLFITTEETPNPFTIKFLPGKRVIDSDEGYDFRSLAQAKNSPLARELLRLSGVQGVFLGPDFISVTKKDDELRWNQIKPLVFSTLMDWFNKEGAVAVELPTKNDQNQVVVEEQEDDEVVTMIKELLEEKVRPMARDDGGDVIFKKFDPNTGVVSVQLVGSCVGCPSSTVTLKMGVENMLRHYIPEVKSVDAETVTSPGDNIEGGDDAHSLKFTTSTT
jgi:Fe-S cluster biogenesis protein NfuA